MDEFDDVEDEDEDDEDGIDDHDTHGGVEFEISVEGADEVSRPCVATVSPKSQRKDGVLDTGRGDQTLACG